ncbi:MULTISPECIES: hypothetical protein [Nocardia]|uniref:hypothetical protein n=1 Tax=Nocardia TaxID=1817 RepID=UPI002676E8CD|nr:hypothetical protein [Nocardia mangyaensis]MDO3649278.1 hypothetical protein [Nocardia mangyaensis]
MVEVEIDDDTVTVHVLGGHRLLALRQQVVIDRAAITEITTAEVDLRPPWVRAPGTFIPGVIAAGVYRGKGRKEFWDTTFGGSAVRIDLDGPDFTRLVVDVDDLDAVLGALTADSVGV